MSDFTADMQLLSALADDPYRPLILTCLVERHPPVALSSLATAIEAHVSETTVEVTQPEIELHHIHLPLLSEFDLVSYYPETHTIEYDVEALETLLHEIGARAADESTVYDIVGDTWGTLGVEDASGQLSSPESSDGLDG